MRARCVAMRMSLLIVAASALRPATLPLPMRPDPSLSVEDVCEACIGGMRDPNSPHLDAGYERLFNFMNYACRKAVTARQGADSLANFTKYGEVSPVIRPLAQAAEVSWSETTLGGGARRRRAGGSGRRRRASWPSSVAVSSMRLESAESMT